MTARDPDEEKYDCASVGSFRPDIRARGATAGTVSPPAAISDAEAHSIGVDTCLYFYPLVTMELTRQQLTNSEPG
jgi:hypothetical protein